MKKLIDDKQMNPQLNKKQIKELPQKFSSHQNPLQKKFSATETKFRETESKIFKDIEFEILSFGYDDPDSKTDLRSITQSEASTSASFSTDISNPPHLSPQRVKTYSQVHTQELRHFAGQNTKCKTFGVQEQIGYTFHYPVERIELSQETESVEDVKAPCKVRFSDSSFQDAEVAEAQVQEVGIPEEKQLRFDKVKDARKILKKEAQTMKKNFSQKTGRCCGRLRRFFRSKPRSDRPQRRTPTKHKQRHRDTKKKTKTKSSPQKVKTKKKKGQKSGVILTQLLPPPDNLEEDLQTKRQLLDFYIYVINLAFITAIALCMVSSNMFYFTNITTSLFFDTKGTSAYRNESDDAESLYSQLKTLREARTLEDFWAFAETTLLDILYWNFYYSRLDPATHKPEDDRKMLYGNQILGVARMRQVRVKSDSCEIHPKVKRFFNECYYYYSVFTEDTTPIKEGMGNGSTATAWEYTEADKLGSSYYWGEISIYGGGGYYQDLATTKEGAAKMLKELKDSFWISKATRALFIDFNIYNANANLFCLCKIVLEFPPTGGVIPVADFHSLKIIRYLTTLDFFILGCEFLYAMFVVYYSWQMLKALIRQKLSFFFIFWNYLDLVILILSYIYIILSIVRYIYSSDLISSLSDRPDQYTEFHRVKSIQITYNNTIAVLLFLCWIKLFQYLNFNMILLEFRITLSRSLKDIMGFFPMFLTMFLAFAFLAYLLFGNQVKTYNTLWLSFLTLLQAFLGEFYYTDIVESNRILGPLFYITYIFFIFFVLLNVFIAIINDAYTSVKSQVIYEKPKTGEYMKRGLVNIFTCGRAHFSRKLRLREMRKKLLFQEIENALKRAGFSAAEIKVFFYKYDINFSNFLDGNTRKRILEDVEFKRIDFSETAEQYHLNSLRRKLEDVTNRLEELELHLQPVVDKVDVLLQRL